MNKISSTTCPAAAPEPMFATSFDAEIRATKVTMETLAMIIEGLTPGEGRVGEVVLRLTAQEYDHLTFYANEVSIRASRLMEISERNGDA